MIYPALALCIQIVHAEGARSPAHYSISECSKQEFLRANDSNQISPHQDSRNIRKSNSTFRLPLTGNANAITLRDITTGHEEKQVRYTFLGEFSDPAFYVISAEYYEHLETLMIDKRTGFTTICWMPPLLSRNRMFLANTSTPYGMEGEPNGVQIWKVDSSTSGLKKIIEIDQDEWVPLSIRWSSDNSLLVEEISTLDYSSETVKQAQSKLRYKKISFLGVRH